MEELRGPQLEVRLFGASHVAAGGVPVTKDRWKRRHAKLLVILLAIQPDRRMHREQIMEALWPGDEMAPAAKANNLDRTIHTARRALEPGLERGADSRFILKDGSSVILSAPGGVRVDTEEFLELVAESRQSADPAALERALSLYRGDLLADEPFVDWAAAYRERVRLIREGALSRLAALHEQRGDHEAAAACLNYILAGDPVNEAAHRDLMLLYVRAGKRDLALRQFKRCTEALARHLGVEPDGETVAAHRQLLSGRPAGLHFVQLTYRRGTVRAARFAPDGETYVYSAAWEGGETELFRGRVGRQDAEALPTGPAHVMAISSRGDMAVGLERRFLRGYVNTGVLARVPLSGGDEPRVIGDGVQWADWSSDGTALAVVRDCGGYNCLEYPIGTILHQTGGWISHPRISPEGDCVAFIHHPVTADDGGEVTLIDLRGRVSVTSRGWVSAQGLAWFGGRVLFTASKTGSARSLYALTLEGDEQLVREAAGTLTLHDISAGGRALVSRDDTRLSISGARAGGREADLSLQDWSSVRDISADGRMILFSEAGEGGGPQYGVYGRGLGGGAPTFLGSGSALALSPDGRWALVNDRGEPPALTLLATDGTGSGARALTRAQIQYQPWGGWFPDGRRVFVVGSEPGRGTRVYVQSLEGGGAPRPLPDQPEGVHIATPHALSPDGRTMALIMPGGEVWLHPVEGRGRARRAEGLEPGEVPARWSADARALIVYRRGDVPARVYRVELDGGARSLLLKLAPADLTGVHEILRLVLTPDLESYAYTYTRDLSALYLLSGLKTALG